MEQKIKEPKQITRWTLVREMLKLGLYVLLMLGAWGLILWGSFIVAFPLGLVMSGISLFFLASALNRVLEDRFYRLAEAYAEGVFPAGRKLEGSDLTEPAFIDDWEGNEDTSLAPLFAKSDLSEDYVPELGHVGDNEEDVIFEQEVSENGVGDDMVFEFEEADAVQLDGVDKQIDDILHGEK